MTNQDLHVEVLGDEIIVTLPGTNYLALGNCSPSPTRDKRLTALQ
jgi:hypothetical protein